MVEQMIRDLARADPRWRVMCLRYFNPVGAHESGTMGEDPRETPNNLMPYVAQVAVGRLPRLRVFGNDYPTPDGTGVRDYIHVTDLAAGHVAAIEQLLGSEPVATCDHQSGYRVAATACSRSCARSRRRAARPIPYDIVERRPGDVAVSCADADARRRIPRLDGEAGPGADVRGYVAMAIDESGRLRSRSRAAS